MIFVAKFSNESIRDIVLADFHICHPVLTLNVTRNKNLCNLSICIKLCENPMVLFILLLLNKIIYCIVLTL